MAAAAMPRANDDGRRAEPPVRVSIVVKALNEERHIEAALESALAAVADVGGEVILADSGSSDRTVDLARRLPVTVVQLAHPEQRRCGVGPQLGYQRARGEFVYLLDGDMELAEGFVAEALREFERDPRLGGVAGLVEEESGASYQFRGRRRRGRERIAGDCDWLDMGGLYRAVALREVGYVSNRNLHAYEEVELGLRLRTAGWSLRRIGRPGVLHHGRPEGTWRLLASRWRSRYLDGAGELLRASLGRPYFLRAARTQTHLFVALGLWAALAAALLLLATSAWLLLVPLAATVGLIAWRARRVGSLRDACIAQVVWQVTALAAVRGFCARSGDPAHPVDHVVLSEPDAETDGHRATLARSA